MWTLTAAGFNPENFQITEGAILHSLWPEPDKFPFMLWSSNYVSTLLGSINEIAPTCMLYYVHSFLLRTRFRAKCNYK